MPKGLCFTAVVFLFLLLSSFFRRLISDVTERISIKLGHVFTYDCYLKQMVRTPPSIYPHGLGAENAFCDRLLTLTKHISATEHDISNRKETCQFTGTPLHALKFGELCSRNGWERLACFCLPYIFALWDTASLTAWTFNIYQTEAKHWNLLFSGTSLQSRTTECQAGSRWALPCF